VRRNRPFARALGDAGLWCSPEAAALVISSLEGNARANGTAIITGTPQGALRAAASEVVRAATAAREDGPAPLDEITVDEAADLLGVGERYVRYLLVSRRLGRGGARKVKSRWFVARAAVEEYAAYRAQEQADRDAGRAGVVAPADVRRRTTGRSVGTAEVRRGGTSAAS